LYIFIKKYTHDIRVNNENHLPNDVHKFYMFQLLAFEQRHLNVTTIFSLLFFIINQIQI